MYNKNKTFKSAVLVNQKKKLKILDISSPNKLKKGQVCVKLISSSICGAQIGEIDGIKGKDKWLPHCLGHEGFGVIVDKNNSVKKVKINDQVILHWRVSKGMNSSPINYLSRIGKINAGQVTTFQEYAVISENRITKIKNFYKFKKIAPLMGCALPTAWGILNKETTFKKENKILIFGAGGIGLTLGAIAKIQKTKFLHIYDKNNKIKFTKLLNLNLKKFKDIKKQKYDLVIETTGNIGNMQNGFDFLNKNGKLILVGQPKLNSVLRLKNPLRLFNSPSDNIKIISSDGGKFNPDNEMKILTNIVKNNFKYLKKLITHEIKLSEINKGIDIIKKGEAGRVTINFK